MEIQNTVIVGMGALGVMYGAQIARAGGAVSFALDPDRFERYQSLRFTCNGAPCRFDLVRADRGEPADLVIVAVKYHSLPSALDTMERFVGSDTILMSVMNGITSEQIIGARYGGDRIVYTVAQGMDAMKFGADLTYTKMGELHIGAVKPAQEPCVAAVSRFFDRVQMPYVVEDDILRRMWCKFMLNVGINQVCMAYETTYAGALAEGEAHDVMLAAMREVIAVGTAEGVQLSEDDLSFYLDILRTLRPDGVPSMRQDGIARRRTEVDMFAGTVLELAGKHGIPAPANQYLYNRVKELEQTF